MRISPCVICRKNLEPALPEIQDKFNNQPNDGVMCSTRGNYGSTVFDPMTPSIHLIFNICDLCLIAREDCFYTVVADLRPRDPRQITRGIDDQRE